MPESSLKASIAILGVKGWPCTYFCTKSVFAEDFPANVMGNKASNRMGPHAHATWKLHVNRNKNSNSTHGCVHGQVSASSID